MNTTPGPIKLQSCPKGYVADLDKSLAPAQTLARVRARLQSVDLDICSGARRIDAGRLDIPVYLGICGGDARAIMPTRKQMGKGSSPSQAEASAVMELMERYAFFSFWQDLPHVVELSWTEAEKHFGDSLIPVEEILLSVGDSTSVEEARKILNLSRWQFYPATCLGNGKITWLPLDWFRMLGEFNGTAAGNTPEESLLQATSELMERHVSCLIDRERPTLPTIGLENLADPVLSGLCRAFRDNGIVLVLKDISLGMPFPTIAALAWDPATFPHESEIVFTAGTASSPAKAAIRAITEVAQLGGDFCTGSCYEASGLPKFTSLDDIRWLLDGPTVRLEDLRDASSDDMLAELQTIVSGVAPLSVYAVDMTHPRLGIPAHYCVIPGFQFRERDKNQSLGLFTGRKLVEHGQAEALEALAQYCPGAHFMPFFQGMLALENDARKAHACFARALPLQPDADSGSLAAFYAGYALFQLEQWQDALPYLRQAAELCPQMRDYASFAGVASYRLKNYADAEVWFDRALKIDKGSAIDLANRGVCRGYLGKTAQARQDLAAALELDPALEFARNRLAELQKED